LTPVRGLRRAGLAPFGAVQAKVTEIGHGYVHLEYSEIDPVGELDSDAGLLAHGWAVLTALKPLCEDRQVDLTGLPLTMILVGHERSNGAPVQSIRSASP
jgi:5'-nucleotidase